MEAIYEKSQKNARPTQKKMEENLYNVRVLDIKAKMVEKELRQKLIHMANAWKKTSKDERRRQYEEIEKLFEKAHNLCDEKIKLAEGTYEMVDTFIQKLDKEMKIYNESVKGTQRTKAQSSAGTSRENIPDEQQSFAGRRRGTAPAASMSTKRGGNAGRASAKAKEAVMASTEKEENGGGGTGADDSGTQIVIGKGDMPIDPNEPRYCYCQQVSFGHMVGCDNKDCPLEWFHFDCVGLNTSPKGKWYCPKCREDKELTRRHPQKTPRSGARAKAITAANGRG